ncbi:hypothetical protein ACTXMB_15430 [Arthrobacter rhombi]|uniref:hypothetical protein n=1 Tax=Arthrobacter rhombi TaxID=71253 RepID=UPI003FD28158
MNPTTNDENEQPGPNVDPEGAAAVTDPGFLNESQVQDNSQRKDSGQIQKEELVDVSPEDGETIRTLQQRPLPDGSSNDSPDPQERPDEGDERYDAG